MDYQHMKIEHIIEWCKENNQVEWLKEAASRTITTEKGERRITFIELKLEFVKKFMPDIAPKSHKPSMYELIAKL